MSRNGGWLACAVLLLGAPGCMGTAAVDVGSSEQALAVTDLEGTDCRDLSIELQTGDCVEAGRVALSLGHDIVWAVGGGIAEDLAMLEIDGMLACSTPVVNLSVGDRMHVISLKPLAARPDPEPASPDETRPDPEPATGSVGDGTKPDESRPDPEPATGSSDSGDDDGTDPDQNRPDPEPAGGGTTTSTIILL